MIKKVIAFYFLFFISGCYSEIVDNITIRESIKIESILIEHGILPKSEKTKDGYSIKVMEEDRLKAISLLSFYELPSQNEVNIEDLFPPGDLVSSPFAEKNRLVYGISSNLKKTIETVPGIISASVDLSYAIDSKIMNINKASIVIVYQSPLNVDANFIEQIKAIVVNANPDIGYNNVSVSSFKKRYTPITRDLISEKDTNSKIYVYILIVVFLLLLVTLAVFTYGRTYREK